MILRKTLPFLAAGVALLASCKKENNAVSSSPAEQPCSQQRAMGDGNIIPGQYIISLKSVSAVGRELTPKEVMLESRRVLQRNKLDDSQIQASFPGEPGGFVAKISDEEAAILRQDPSVKLVEHDRVVALAPCFTVVEPRLITWNIHKTGYGDGTGKTAWIIDSGIDFGHPDLNVDHTRSRSFISGVTSADDDNGHGTHVAGIIGGRNNTIGVLGVASNANLVALKVLGSDGVGSLSSIIQALAYINSNAKAGDVVNMSLGDEGVSQIMDEQVQNTASRGILFAIAAGNDGRPAVEFSPARVNGPNIFTISAVDSLDRFASFSNYGNDVVDYAAPGVRILSTFTDGRYAIMSGTSMAAPHVAGLLLLNGRNFSSSTSAVNDPDGVPDRIAQKR